MTKSTEQYNQIKGRHLRKRIIGILVAVAVIAGAAYYLWTADAQNSRLRLIQRYRTVFADEGDVVVTVSADGTVSAALTKDLLAPATGTLKQFHVNEGDFVREGETIGVIEKDTKSIEREIEQLENTLAQLNQQKKNAQAAYDERVIKAPVEGRIKDVRATVDEDASVTLRTFGYLALISPNGRMEVQVVSGALMPMVGSQVSVVRDETGEEIPGVVTKSLAQPEESPQAQQDSRILAYEGGVFVVEINRDDLPVGAPVTISMQGVGSLGTGTLAVQAAVLVQGAGTISNILKGENQPVARGEAVFRINSNDISRAVVSQQLQIDQTSKQLEDRVLQLNTAEEAVVASSSGIFTQTAAREGMDVYINRVMGSIVSQDALEAVVSVDELDILKLETGQRVQIVADAMVDQPFGGTVKEIAALGAVGQNRTTYDVTVALNPPEQLRIGMSIHVNIDVKQSGQTVRVPVEALRETRSGPAVLLATLLDDPDIRLRSEQAIIPQEVLLRHLRPVTVGLVNTQYAQIRSGLTPGEAVLADTSTSSLFDLFMQNMTPGQAQPAMSEGKE